MASKIGDKTIDMVVTLLKWEGVISNARLRDVFKLRSSQASHWISGFRAEYSRYLKQDRKTKIYYPTYEFNKQMDAESKLKSKEADSFKRYLFVINESEPENNYISTNPFTELALPNQRIFSVINQAVRMHCAVEITYRSMNTPAPHKRMITPRLIIKAGRRWHTRAFCHENREFRDYALGRIVDAKISQKVQPESEKTVDIDWDTKVSVRLVAHPGLTPEQQDLIKFEYFNGTSSLITSCRVCLLKYYIQDIRAAVDIPNQTAPDYQLAVDNIKEIAKWLYKK